MVDDLRWLSRYQYFCDLWRGRDRIIVDPTLEQLLCGPQWETFCRRHPAAAALLGELVPDYPGGQSVWMLLSDVGRARVASAKRGGTVFLGFDDGPDLPLDSAWGVALVDLGQLVSAPRSASAGDTDLGLRIDPRFQALLSMLSQRAQGGRQLVISLPAGDALDERASYDDFVDLVTPYIPDACYYGLAAPPVTEVFRFVEDDDEGGEDGEVGVEFDNTLGSDDADVFAFVASTAPAPLDDQMTLIELPSGHRSSARADLGDVVPRESPADESAEPEAAEPGDEEIAARLDQALAREQALRWQLERVQGELHRALGRPVSDQEMELAVLRARASTPDKEAGRGQDTARKERGKSSQAAVARLGTVLRRLEQGDGSSTALHRELTQIRRLMGRLR